MTSWLSFLKSSRLKHCEIQFWVISVLGYITDHSFIFRTVLRDLAWWYWWSWLSVPGPLVKAKFSSAGMAPEASAGPVLLCTGEPVTSESVLRLHSHTHLFSVGFHMSCIRSLITYNTGSLCASETIRKLSVWHYVSSELWQDLSEWRPYIYTSLVPWRYWQYDTTHHQSYDKTYQCDTRTCAYH